MMLLLCALAASTVATAAPQGPTDLERFRQAASQAVLAFRAGDLDTADQRLTEAQAAMPDQPSALLSAARLYLAERDEARAARTLERYADLGLTLPPARAKPFEAVLATPAFARAAEKLAANARPLGEAKPVFQTDAEPILVEKVAFDAEGRLLLGTVRSGGVFRVEDARLVRLTPDNLRFAVLGMQADKAHGDLWVAASALPQVAPPEIADKYVPFEGSRLLRLDLKTGAEKASYPLEDSGRHSWGDLTLADDGTVYLSDGQSGEIWRLKPGAPALDLVLKSRRMDSPQGMVASRDGRYLLAADYTTGFVRIDLKTGEERRVPPPPGATLTGVDGLASDGTTLYGFQNGVTPDRVIAVRLDRDWTRATSVKVLLRKGLVDQPTSGVVDHGALVFVARSQWSDFTAEDGSPSSASPAPAIVARLGLRP